MQSASSAVMAQLLIIAGSSQRRAAFEKMLRSELAIRVVGALPAIAGASAYIEHWQPDVVLIDLDRQHAEPLIEMLSGNFADVAVVVLAEQAQPGWSARMLRAGVASILSRDSSPEQIAAAVRAAAEELIILGQDVAQGLLASSLSMGTAKTVFEDREKGTEQMEPMLEELTRREMEVLRMVADGLSNREIAARLSVSEHTIKFHISSVLGKLGASSRTEAVTQGIKRGLILL